MDKPDADSEEKTPVAAEGKQAPTMNGGPLVHFDLNKASVQELLDIPLDSYAELDFTDADLRKIRLHALKMRTGLQAMAPILCLGPNRCPFRMRCPVVDRDVKTATGEIDFFHQDIKKFPLFKQCPFERDFLEFKRKQYLEEFDVDPSSPTDMGLVNKLAELDLYDYRATLVLANGDREGQGMDLLKNQVVGVSKTGEIMTSLITHPAWELKERLQKQRSEILNMMVGTRREKYKKDAALNQRDAGDAATIAAALRARLDSLNSKDVIDAEFQEHKPDGSDGDKD